MERPWTRATIHQILTNPKYVGANVYNRRSYKLKIKRLVNPPEMWIIRKEAFQAIVSTELFLQARRIIEARHNHLTNDDLLARLRNLLGALRKALRHPHRRGRGYAVQLSLRIQVWWSPSSLRAHWVERPARLQLHRSQSPFTTQTQKSDRHDSWRPANERGRC